MSAREDVRIHGLVARHPDAQGEPTGELCIHVRRLPDEDTQRPVATVCTALHCVRLDVPEGVVDAGTWCTVYGTIDIAATMADAGTPEPAERLRVTVERLGKYPNELRDSWSELAEDDSGFGFVELSAPFARRRSRRTSRSPLRTTDRLIAALKANDEIAERSGHFDTGMGGGGSYVAGHGYASSVNALIVTDEMRAWLETTAAEVVICPVVQRRV